MTFTAITFRSTSTPLVAGNDNLPSVVPMPPREWDIYRAARHGRFIGRVVASDARAAIGAAALKFEADIRKLIAVRRPERRDRRDVP